MKWIDELIPRNMIIYVAFASLIPSLEWMNSFSKAFPTKDVSPLLPMKLYKKNWFLDFQEMQDKDFMAAFIPGRSYDHLNRWSNI